MQKRCYVCEKIIKNSKASFRINDNPEFRETLGKSIEDLNNQVICMECKTNLLIQNSLQKIENFLSSAKKLKAEKIKDLNQIERLFRPNSLW